MSMFPVQRNSRRNPETTVAVPDEGHPWCRQSSRGCDACAPGCRTKRIPSRRRTTDEAQQNRAPARVEPSCEGCARRARDRGSVLAVTASAVSAIQACHWPPEGGSNTCLTITRLDNGVCSIHVGIDVHMSPDDAQFIIDHHGAIGWWSRPFGAQVMAHDHDNPDDDTSGLGEVPTTEGPVVWARGLSVGFATVFGSSVLNEDADGRDEVYARVELHDPAYPEPRRFRSGIITGDDYWDCFNGRPDPVPDPEPEPEPEPDPIPEPDCGPIRC